MTIKFDATSKELKLINKIVDRAMTFDPSIEHISVMMDLDACISNGTPLKLEELLEADDFNFQHDVFGIMCNIDRNTDSTTAGQMLRCFRPRFAK